LALVIVASATSTPKPDIAVAGEKGLTSRLGLQKGSKPKAETPSPAERWTGAPASSGMVALAACFTELLHTRRVAASYAVFAVVFAAVA
jgi:hypothetical protein